MLDNNNFSITDLRCRPYDPSSALAREFPGDSHFDSRNHFLMFKNQSHLAVYITVLRQVCFAKDLNPESIILNVTLSEADTFETIQRRCISLDPSDGKPVCNIRTDLPLAITDVSMDREYILAVSDCNGITMFFKKVRFYCLPEIKMLPTKWYAPKSGCIIVNRKGIDSETMSPGAAADTDVRISFNVESLFPDCCPQLPQLEIHLTYPDGPYASEWVNPESHGSDGNTYLAEACFGISEHHKGIHYAELRSMGYPIAGFLFSTEGREVAGRWEGADLAPLKPFNPANAARHFDTLIKRRAEQAAKAPAEALSSLTGLDEVKKRIVRYTRLAGFNRTRIDAGLPQINTPLHSMFLGSPGTGKTTVAKIMGKLLKDAGVLSKGHVVVHERATLCGIYYNTEAEKTLKAIEDARGGILFIDEAYQLHRPEDPRDPGKFVIDTLLTALADESARDWMLILAGYTEPMKRLFDINPGLRSRIPASNIFVFDDFDEDQLMEIAVNELKKYNFILSAKAATALRLRLACDYRQRQPDFGNARHVVNLLHTEVIPAMAERLAANHAPTVRQLRTVTAADIPAPQIAATARPRTAGFAI